MLGNAQSLFLGWYLLKVKQSLQIDRECVIHDQRQHLEKWRAPVLFKSISWYSRFVTPELFLFFKKVLELAYKMEILECSF